MSAGRPGETYPAACLRGLRKKEWIVEDPKSGLRVCGDAFTPEKAAEPRDWCENWLETSVNWEDDHTVVGETRAQRSEKGHPLNPQGVARLTVDAIEESRRLVRVDARLRYERRSQPGLEHHGNVLFDHQLPKQMQRMVAGALALASIVVTDTKPDQAG
ncbi:MAG: hypothetical protein ACT4QB_17305 [Gammaproteobacteria bacterium]